jgi:hypothetical protein
MRKRLVILDSGWLTATFLIILAGIIVMEVKIATDWRAQWTAGDKAWKGANQAKALANAIEQYYVDFPTAESFVNTRQWTERLAGHNPKRIRYLKVEKFHQDSDGRLLDLCGKPWIIDVPASPEFQHIVSPEPADEFHVRSDGCPGFAFGHRNHPAYPRSGEAK